MRMALILLRFMNFGVKVCKVGEGGRSLMLSVSTVRGGREQMCQGNRGRAQQPEGEECHGFVSDM